MTPMTAPAVALLGVPYDASSSFRRGAAGAPAPIREALWSPASSTWSETGADLGAGGLTDAGNLTFEEGEPGEVARARIEVAIDRLAASGLRPVSLGGDHSITYPLLRGFRRHHPRLAILHLDAHGDLWDEFEGDRFSHACPFARIMEEGLAQRLVQVGIRTMNPPQRRQAQRYGVELIEMRSWEGGARPRVDGPVYLSVDLDALDPAFAPGVSHREPGGLSVRDVLSIIQQLGGTLVGADVVEYNPRQDLGGVTAVVAAKIVKEIAGRMLGEAAGQEKNQG